MKKLILILLFLPLTILAQKTYVPDNNFENYLENNGMGDGISNNDSVFTNNINTITYLNINSLAITNLTGIGGFTDLEHLECQNNNITTLNLNQNINLEHLRCYGNNLTSLLIDSCVYLEYLHGSNNFLTTLNTSNNILLKELGCYQNNLTTLDLSNNTNLIDINCSENYLNYININNCSLLIVLNCSDNILSSINLTTNTSLRELYLWDNNLDSLSINSNTLIEKIYCERNNLTQIDASNNVFLQHLQCYTNNITELHLENCTFLEFLECAENQIDSLDVTNNLYLKYLVCNSNNLTSLDVSNNIYLEDLDCAFNNIDSLDLTNNVNIDLLWCLDNNLHFLDLQNGNNQLITNYDSWGNPNLYCINVDDTSWSNIHWTSIDPWSIFSTNCNNNPIYGCIDILACNYNPFATIDDGSCLLPDGCTDPTACNYDVSATCDDGTCLWVNIFVSSSNVSCYGSADGAIVATATGGILPYQYSLGAGMSQSNGNFINLGAGTYYVDVTDVNGCSSNQLVIINEPLPLISNNTINDCDSVLIGNNYYTISGTYTDTFTSVNGCDSVINTNLTIEYSTTTYDTVSASGSYYWAVDGNTYNSSGIYTHISSTVSGCDSIAYLNLNITNTTGINDLVNKKRIVNITNILGQTTPYRRNTPLFYIYDNGTVEKRIIIE